MTNKLKWHEAGTRLYETGISHVAMYLKDDTGVFKGGAEAWNGVVGVTQSPSGAESNKSYALNEVYINLTSVEELSATIEAFTYPKLFSECDGSAQIQPGVFVEGQERKEFGLAYKTILGNDLKKASYGYKLHLIYNALAAPSERAYTTVNTTQEPMAMSWELSTTPVNVTGMLPTAMLTIDSTMVKPEQLKALEEILFGSDTKAAYLPLPDEVATILASVQG